MTAVDRIEQYLKENRFMSIRKGRELGYKTPGNAVGYLNSRGHDIVGVSCGDIIGDFRVPERGYYMISAADEPKSDLVPVKAKDVKKTKKKTAAEVFLPEPFAGVQVTEQTEQTERPAKTIDGLIECLKDKCDWYRKMDCESTLSVKIMTWVIEELEEIKLSA